MGEHACTCTFTCLPEKSSKITQVPDEETTSLKPNYPKLPIWIDVRLAAELLLSLSQRKMLEFYRKEKILPWELQSVLPWFFPL